MKLAETEMKQLITIFLRLSWGINTVEHCLESIGINVTIGRVSPLDVGRLGDFILDMFEVKDQIKHDWFYMTTYDHIDLTEDTLENRTNEIFDFLCN